MHAGLKSSLVGLALMGSVFGASSGAQAYQTIGTPYPTVGYDSGPSYIITINMGGSLTITATGLNTVNYYGGTDDTYIAVENKSGMTVNSLTLTSTLDIFGFDGDGIDNYGVAGNSKDTTGYGGTDTYFTVVTPYTGSLNFIGGLQDGYGTYLSLEENLAEVVGTPGGITGGVGTVPLPASLPMFGGALAALGVVAYGAKRRKAGSATA